jgi:hypothetical protein
MKPRPAAHALFAMILAAASLSAAGLACDLAGSAPQAGAVAATPTVALPVEAMPLPATLAANSAAPMPAMPETRRLTLEFPGSIRVGDSDVVRLTLEVDDRGNLTPTAEVQGNTVKGQTVQIPNVYETQDVYAEARLDLAGPVVKPPDLQSEAIAQGQAATFYWSVQPLSAGTFRGTVWFYLRFVDKASHHESTRTVSAQPIQIAGADLLGLSGNLARSAGGIGAVVGAVLGLPFADDLLKWIFARFRGAGA